MRRAASSRSSANTPILLLLAGALTACGASSGPETQSHAVVYGNDDRRELFEAADPAVRARAAGAVVALIPRERVVLTARGLAVEAPALGQVADLCVGERFAEQPSAAFCSGVLVDRDLVLTSGHCLHVHAASTFLVVFGYYYRAPDRLALDDGDVFEVAGTVAEALDDADVRPRLDYGWLRLAREASPRHAPAPIRTSLGGVVPGAPLASVSTPGGTPLKIDQGAVVASVGQPWLDYFVASSDTAKGSSGGPAFDGSLSVLGILGRGGEDYATTAEGCRETVRQPPGQGEEEFTFANRALEGLCAGGTPETSLCRADCGDPCSALFPTGAPPDGCAVSGRKTQRASLFWVVLAAAWMRAARRRGLDSNNRRRFGKFTR